MAEKEETACSCSTSDALGVVREAPERGQQGVVVGGVAEALSFKQVVTF